MTTQDIERLTSESRGVDPAKRAQIIDGARRVFLAQGFDAASMGAIAREAGVSKGTLYVYFKSKEELFEAIVEEERRHQADHIFTLDEEAAVATELRRLGVELARFLCRPGGVSTLLLPLIDGEVPLEQRIAIADRMPELGARFYQSGPATGVGRLKHYLEAKIASGVLKPHDCEVAAAQFIDSCLSTTFKPMLFNFAGPPDDARILHVVDIAVSTFLAAYQAR